MKLNEIKFEKTDVLKINLETLKASADYKRGAKYPMSHYELIERIMNDLGSKGIEANIESIYVAKNGCQYPTEKYVQNSSDISSIYDTRGVIINNIITKITLGGELSDEESGQAIAISYNKSGIQIAMGLNVWICANMNVFGNTVVKNYGGDGVPFDKMLHILAGWIANAFLIRKRDLRVLAAMKGITFMNPEKEMDEIIGNLYRLNELSTDEKGIVAPLNHSRTTDLLRNFLKIESKNPTLYDLYQAATETSTHQNTIENRIKDTHLVGEYFADRFGIDLSIHGNEIIVEDESQPKGLFGRQDIDETVFTLTDKAREVLDEPNAVNPPVQENPLAQDQSFEIPKDDISWMD